MVSVRIVCVGNLKEKYWKDAMAEYGKRLSRFCNFEVIETPESDPEKEKIAIIKNLQGYVFSLCVEGKEDRTRYAVRLKDNVCYRWLRRTFGRSQNDVFCKTVVFGNDFSASAYESRSCRANIPCVYNKQ